MNDIDHATVNAKAPHSTVEAANPSASPITTSTSPPSSFENSAPNGTHANQKSLSNTFAPQAIESAPSSTTEEPSTVEINGSKVSVVLDAVVLNNNLQQYVEPKHNSIPEVADSPISPLVPSSTTEHDNLAEITSIPTLSYTPSTAAVSTPLAADAPTPIEQDVEQLQESTTNPSPTNTTPGTFLIQDDTLLTTTNSIPSESYPQTTASPFHSPLPGAHVDDSDLGTSSFENELKEEHDNIENSRGSLLPLAADEGEDKAEDDDDARDEEEDLVARNRQLEEQLAKANATITALESSDTHDELDTVLEELQTNLEVQMDRRAKAEAELQSCQERANHLEQEWESQKQSLQEQLQQLLQQFELRTTQIQQQNQSELQKLRDHLHDEHERKEHALICRLNEAKKKEAVEANRAERFETELQRTQVELEQTKHELTTLKECNLKAEIEWNQSLQQCRERLAQTEHSLAEERRLNEERKRKMKAFVESKAEELRISKEEMTTLHAELDQTNRSLLELNSRWKLLHAQWVQSQTRNRELQRDLNRIQKDSETLHRVGGTLEMKLERSAQETEEHKNKRLTAKHELMTVLRSLDVEKEVGAKLRDSIKFTFTPKALSQQQLLKECLSDLDNELSKLSRRMGRPLATSSTASEQQQQLAWMDLSNNSARDAASPELDVDHDNSNNALSPKRNKSAAETDQLLANLEDETQRVSQCIMRLTYSVEQLHQLLDDRANRNCITMISNLLGSSSSARSATNNAIHQSTGVHDASDDGGFLSDAASSRLGLRRYGQVPAHDSILT